MKKFRFKDGAVITANTAEEAKKQHKVSASAKEFTVYVGGSEINDNLLTLEEAKKLADSYRNKGYDDVSVLNVTTNKVVAAFPFDKKEDKAEEYVLVPVNQIVNKSWLLKYKKLLIIGENTVGIKTGLKKEKLARTIQKMNKLIHEDI